MCTYHLVFKLVLPVQAAAAASSQGAAQQPWRHAGTVRRAFASSAPQTRGVSERALLLC